MTELPGISGNISRWEFSGSNSSNLVYEIILSLVLQLIKPRSVGTAMLRLSSEVLRNLVYRCSNSSPRYSVRTTMLSLYTIQKFLRFPLYKISITLLLFLVCLWKESPQSTAKVQKVRDMAFNYHGLYDDLQVNTPILSPRLWFQLLHKLLFLPSEPKVMRNTIDSKVKSSLFVFFEWADRTIGWKRLVKHRWIEFTFNGDFLKSA